MQELPKVCQSPGVSSWPSNFGRPNKVHCRPKLTVLAFCLERSGRVCAILERTAAVSQFCG
jgi:hypothetical protein